MATIMDTVDTIPARIARLDAAITDAEDRRAQALSQVFPKPDPELAPSRVTELGNAAYWAGVRADRMREQRHRLQHMRHLAGFATAKLFWKRWTVTRPGGSVDGTLIAETSAGEELRFPVCIFSPEDERTAMRDGKPRHEISHEGVAVIWAETPEGTPAEAERLITEWCKATLGRDDVEFI
ncbi:hypothetical protein ABT332_13565 [Saccharomonospora azurea]|uniref:hypothetical protein n=1 Tax=Saccharomonospora azurea TaxID=40988 RepID=UPI003333E8B6